MPTQEYAADAAGKSRVQVYREYDGGDLTILLDRVIVGSVLTEENGERNREIPLKDGSVLKVQVLDDQVQVLKDDEVLPPVPPAEPEKIKPRRSETASQTIYVLGHPSVNTFDEEIFEAAWGGIWGRTVVRPASSMSMIFEASWGSIWGKIIGYAVLFLVIAAVPLITHIISAFSPVYLLALVALAVIFGVTVPAFIFLVIGVPYFLAKQLGGKAKFMEHAYLLIIILMPLVIFPFVVPLIGVLYQVYNPPNSTQLSANLDGIQRIFEYILILLSIYYFVLAIPALMSVHKLKPGAAAITAFVSLVLIWLAVLGLAFSGYLLALAHFYFQILPK